jgi:inositol phosphorylceramide mannosyltransferase catalytic subunit
VGSPVSLSVCCLTGDPGPRVAAVLEPFRAVADELVIAADARADRERLEQYAAVADRVVRVQFSYFERHLAWLHAQCSGDWVFRIDADEVASPVLVERLPELVADRHLQQAWFPRRWLFPDATHWVEEVPWWPDYQNRLVRNDGTLRFTGLQHTSAEPTRPALYAEEPLYHLAFLLDDIATRRSKGLKYEVLRPQLPAPGGGSMNRRIYLPELYARRAPAAAPERDRAAVAAALSAESAPRRELGELAFVPLAESDRHWGLRTIADDAYAAEIALLEAEPRLAPGEIRAIHVRVTNRGSEIWPWGAAVGPEICCAYRWRHANGALLVAEGHRTYFTCDVHPDESVVVPLLVEAPTARGSFLLEVDVVHEGVRWFGAEQRFPAEVAEPPAERATLPPEALAAPDGPERSLLSRLRRNGSNGQIPKVVHRIWLGNAEMPPELAEYGETWRHHHPAWKFKLWRDRDLRRLVPADAVARARHRTELSDLFRFAVLRRHGGVYVDTDVERLRPFDELLVGHQVVLGYERPGRVGSAVLASVPGHPFFVDAARQAARTVGLGANSADATGPYLLTLLARDYPEVTILPPDAFYPYGWDEPERRHDNFPGSYAVHHWASLDGLRA